MEVVVQLNGWAEQRGKVRCSRRARTAGKSWCSHTRTSAGCLPSHILQGLQHHSQDHSTLKTCALRGSDSQTRVIKIVGELCVFVHGGEMLRALGGDLGVTKKLCLFTVSVFPFLPF